MLTPSALVSILLALPPVTDPVTANQQVANAISAYVIANADVNFAWAATLGPTADPVTTATGKIIAFPLTLTPSGITTYPASVANLSTQITAKWLLATYNITAPGFLTSPVPVGAAAPLVLNITGNTIATAMTLFATQIINWIKGQTPASPVSGTRAPYSGTGTIVSIQ